MGRLAENLLSCRQSLLAVGGDHHNVVLIEDEVGVGELVLMLLAKSDDIGS